MCVFRCSAALRSPTGPLALLPRSAQVLYYSVSSDEAATWGTARLLPGVHLAARWSPVLFQPQPLPGQPPPPLHMFFSQGRSCWYCLTAACETAFKARQVSPLPPYSDAKVCESSRFGLGHEWPLSDGQRPHFRVVRVALGMGYNLVRGKSAGVAKRRELETPTS
jgi:hypothetical protein